MSRANWLVLGLVLVLGGSVAVARDARVFPLSPSGSGGAGGSGGDVTLAGDNDFTGRNRFLSDGGIQARLFNASTSDFYGNSFADAGIQTSDGGGLGMTRVAAYNCSGVVNGVPCVANPYGIVEIYGSLPVAETTPFVCAVEVYDYNDQGASTDTCVMGLGVGATSTKIVRFTGDGSAHLGGSLYLSGSKIAGRTGGYVELQTNAASSGVGVYISNTGGTLASGGSMLAFYNPGYSGSNVAQVEYDGALISGSARTKGTITIGGGGTGTATVVSGSVCTCSNTAALNAVRCTVATTTLTATGTAADVIAYICL